MANRFFEGNYAPVVQEHTVTQLEVTGHLPEYLDGRYLRNGPNPVGADLNAMHWFLGDGMVHGVRLRGGRAEWYRNRFVRTPRIDSFLGQGNEQPGVLIGANTNVIGHAGRTFAVMEGGLPVYELTEELETICACDFDGTLPGGYTGHPKRDPRTGELHAVTYQFGQGNRVQYSVIGTDARARRTVDVEVTGAPMMHDFSLTERFVVFYDLPVTFAPDQKPVHVDVPDPVTAHNDRGMTAMPYRWNPDYPARIGVMPRAGGNADVRWFEVEPCYVFHPLNAYDDGDRLVLDVIRHARVFEGPEHRGPQSAPTLYRWIVDLGSGKVVEQPLDDQGQEFPRVDERLVGLPHRFGYAITAGDVAKTTGDLYKHDLLKGSTQRHAFGPGRQPGEFVFVPSRVDAAEDDGVLMGFVFDAATQRSELTLLDAGTLETVAAVHLPDRVPHGFHGNWVPVS
ncbi:carotenoid oxygenase family protein [Amycolatopsis sp. NPDC004368]